MDPIERRLVRIESRLVQIMLHLGIDPYKKMYEQLEETRENTNVLAKSSQTY